MGRGKDWVRTKPGLIQLPDGGENYSPRLPPRSTERKFQRGRVLLPKNGVANPMLACVETNLNFGATTNWGGRHKGEGLGWRPVSLVSKEEKTRITA